eukprot:PhF_6_TR18875/c0_g1_i2/m.27467
MLHTTNMNIIVVAVLSIILIIPERVGVNGQSLSTWGGTGSATHSGDGSAMAIPGFLGLGGTGIKSPHGIVDLNDIIYFTGSTSEHTIRKIVVSSSVITNYAGATGSSGTATGSITSTRFNTPCGITGRFVTNARLYVADYGNNAVKYLDVGASTSSSIIGGGTASTPFNVVGPSALTIGIRTLAQLEKTNPKKMFFVAQDSGGTTGYIVQYSFQTLVVNTLVTTSGVRHGLAFHRGYIFHGTDTASSTLQVVNLHTGISKSLITTYTSGILTIYMDCYRKRLLVTHNDCDILAVSLTDLNSATRFAGTGSAGQSGDSATSPTSATLDTPSGYVVDVSDPTIMYICDTGNHKMRMVTGISVGTSGACEGTF